MLKNYPCTIQWTQHWLWCCIDLVIGINVGNSLKGCGRLERTVGCWAGSCWCTILYIKQHIFNVMAGQSSSVRCLTLQLVGHCWSVLRVFIFRLFSLYISLSTCATDWAYPLAVSDAFPLLPRLEEEPPGLVRLNTQWLGALGLGEDIDAELICYMYPLMKQFSHLLHYIRDWPRWQVGLRSEIIVRIAILANNIQAVQMGKPQN